MDSHQRRFTRIRYTATGALATLAAVGAIAGTVALAAGSHAHAAASSGTTTTGQTTQPGPVKQWTSGQWNPTAMQADVQRLVNDGTISAAQGQVLDSSIQAGRIIRQTLVSNGFTDAQIQAVQEAFGT